MSSTMRVELPDDVAPETVRSDLPLEVGGDGRTWGEARDRLVADLQRPTVGGDSLTELATPDRHSPNWQFSPAWSERTWRRLWDHHRWATEWCERTVLLTFTGRTRLPSGDRPLPPLTHFERIRDSREARNKALSRAMNDVGQWSAITVVGAHETGHCHVHTGVWTSEPVGAERFESLIRAHVENSQVATRDAHGAGAVRVRSDSQALTDELGVNAPGLDTSGDRGHGLLSEPEHRQFGATVLEVGGYRAVRF